MVRVYSILSLMNDAQAVGNVQAFIFSLGDSNYNKKIQIF